MDNNFILNSSGWDYANLAKSAAAHCRCKNIIYGFGEDDD